VNAPLVLKLGGELLESAADRQRISLAAAEMAATRPLAIVHGGGRAIDTELARRGIAPRKVDGLRVTDADTLDAVVAVLAGSANTALVAALAAEGISAVGLTGADAGLGRAARAAAYRSTTGATVDLGLVGDAVHADVAVLRLLLQAGHVPVIASLGLELGGRAVLNINADVMACAIASRLPGCDLVIAGMTAGVLDDAGATISTLEAAEVDSLIASGTATAGMIAKLSACRSALDAGVARVRIIDGRLLDSHRGIDDVRGTTLVAVHREAAREVRRPVTA
jgi:acetylglutamate kinase